MGNKKNRGRDYTPTSETRDWAKRFLHAWEYSGGSFSSYAEFCDVQDWNYHKCRRLRSKWDNFRDAMDNIAARFDIQDETSPPINTAEEHFPEVEGWKRLWLEKWRLSKNRMEACKVTSKTWKQVQEELEDDSDFRAAYEEVEAELELAVQDAQVRAALEGHNSAMNAILKPDRSSNDDEAFSVARSSGARKKWRDIYGRHHGSVEATG